MAKRVYFAFHYQDVIDFRANVVRKHDFTKDIESAGFFDASIWETAKKTSDLALKRMINAELKNTSVTAILIGTETYVRPWVRYEIFKSLEMGNYLVGVHINQISGKDQKTKPIGLNPFDYCGLRISADGKKGAPIILRNEKWYYFSNLDEFSIREQPANLREQNIKLSHWYKTYDWVANKGYDNFSTWIG
jgi:hypothetical protein